MNAFFGAWLFVPVTPEIIESVADSLKSKWRSELQLSNLNNVEIESEIDKKYE